MREDAHEQLKMQERKGSLKVVYPSSHGVIMLQRWRTHFKQSVGKDTVDSPISTSEGPEPIKPKSKLKTKTGLTEEGNITNRGVITRIFVLTTNQTRSMNFTRRSPVQRT
jgi:hypothetical protein